MSSLISSLISAELPTDLPWSEFGCGVVQSASTIQFLRLPDQAAEAVKFPQGHAFGEKAELRWLLRANGKYHLVYINDGGTPLAGSTQPATLTRLGDGQVILWGEREGDGDTFFDGRIPETLRYPTNARGSRLAMQVRYYLLTEPWPNAPDDDNRKRQVALFRCIKLVPAKRQL